MANSSPMFIVVGTQLVNVSMIQQIMLDIEAKKIKIVLNSPTIINVNYVDEEVMYREYIYLKNVLHIPLYMSSDDLSYWEDKMTKQIKEKQAEQEKDELLKNAGLFR